MSGNQERNDQESQKTRPKRTKKQEKKITGDLGIEVIR